MLRDLADWSARRPMTLPEGKHPVPHSSDVRMVVWAFAGTDLVTGLVIDAMLPPAGRAVHLVWVVLSLVLSLGFCAMTARAPHLLDSAVLRLRTGPFREVTIPVGSLGSVRVAHGSTRGYGLRHVPDEDGAVACTIGGATNLVIELEEPLPIRLRNGESVLAGRVYAAADNPAEAARLINRSIAGGARP
ncbi:hypothetical protein [Streptomyces odonnellii]|uniref:hypothetical protein n=1 Tax=Streptomyces odonnellii TaxID=1417980 RepID=UPI000625C84D|nr:hypothetical protein [Streptomyces odonnellii]